MFESSMAGKTLRYSNYQTARSRLEELAAALVRGSTPYGTRQGTRRGPLDRGRQLVITGRFCVRGAGSRLVFSAGFHMTEQHDNVIVGGGQAGLAMSAVLRQRGLEHVVLERRHVGERWRTERWESLRFQFPNW